MFMKIRPVGDELIHADRQTDRQTDRRTVGQTDKKKDGLADGRENVNPYLANVENKVSSQ